MLQFGARIARPFLSLDAHLFLSLPARARAAVFIFPRAQLLPNEAAQNWEKRTQPPDSYFSCFLGHWFFGLS